MQQNNSSSHFHYLCTQHRVWATPDKVDQTEYALGVGQSIADYFADIFDEPFTLPKLDQLAVPDYPSGATEHWGLVTYREARLLYDPTQVGSYDKQRIASIVAHELAHSVSTIGNRTILFIGGHKLR